MLVKCPEHLSRHPGGTTGAELLLTMQAWAGEYNECAARHNALIDSITPKQKK